MCNLTLTISFIAKTDTDFQSEVKIIIKISIMSQSGKARKMDTKRFKTSRTQGLKDRITREVMDVYKVHII